MPEKKDAEGRDVAVNRRAYHDYFVDETYECVDVVRAPSRVVHVTIARRSR